MSLRLLFIDMTRKASAAYKGIYLGSMYWVTNTGVLVLPTDMTEVADHTIANTPLLELAKPLFLYHPRSISKVLYLLTDVDKLLVVLPGACIAVTPSGKAYWVSQKGKDSTQYLILSQAFDAPHTLSSRLCSIYTKQRLADFRVSICLRNSCMLMLVLDNSGSCLSFPMLHSTVPEVHLLGADNKVVLTGWDLKHSKYIKESVISQKGPSGMAIPKNTSDLLKIGKAKQAVAPATAPVATPALEVVEEPQKTGTDVVYDVPDDMPPFEVTKETTSAQKEAQQTDEADKSLLIAKARNTRVRKRIVPGLDMDFRRAIEYFGQPVSQDVTAEAAAQELRDIRDLQIAAARRAANLALAVIDRSKDLEKIRDVLKGLKI